MKKDPTPLCFLGVIVCIFLSTHQLASLPGGQILKRWYIEGVSGPRHAEGRLFGCANSATTHAILPDGWGYAPVARFERTRQVMSKGREGGEKEGREADGRRVGRGGK